MVSSSHGTGLREGLCKQIIDSVLSVANEKLISAFELLRYPGVATANLKAIIPALANVDPYILARIDVDGRFGRLLSSSFPADNIVV